MRGVNIINEVKTTEKVVAFTFDDGPNDIYTPQLLEMFEEVSGKATFFMIGEQMVKSPEIVKLVAKKGHEIGNHTFTHPKLTQLSTNECMIELNKTDNLIEEMTGNKPTTFRPPYLDFNNEVASIVDTFGYSTIGALNIDATDWEMPGVDHIYTKSLNHIRNGSILIFHDGFEDRSQTIEAVSKLIKELDSQGYRLVTVSELLHSQE